MSNQENNTQTVTIKGAVFAPMTDVVSYTSGYPQELKPGFDGYYCLDGEHVYLYRLLPTGWVDMVIKRPCHDLLPQWYPLGIAYSKVGLSHLPESCTVLFERFGIPYVDLDDALDVCRNAVRHLFNEEAAYCVAHLGLKY